MADELFIQQVVPGGYTVATYNETALSADKHGFFYKFPSQLGAVDVHGFNVRLDSIASFNSAVGNIIPAAVFSVFAEDETNYLNGYFNAPLFEIYGSTYGLCGQAVLDTPVRVELSETCNVAVPDVVATVVGSGFSCYTTFLVTPLGR